jgi:hypothetical protein
MAAAAAVSGEYGPKHSVNSDGIVAKREKKKRKAMNRHVFGHVTSSSVLFHAFVQIINFDSKRKERRRQDNSSSVLTN